MLRAVHGDMVERLPERAFTCWLAGAVQTRLIQVFQEVGPASVLGLPECLDRTHVPELVFKDVGRHLSSFDDAAPATFRIQHVHQDATQAALTWIGLHRGDQLGRRDAQGGRQDAFIGPGIVREDGCNILQVPGSPFEGPAEGLLFPGLIFCI